MIEQNFRKPNLYEEALLNALLAPQFPGREELATQFANCLVRGFDQNGSFEFKVDGTKRADSVKHAVPTEAEYEDENGIIIHFLLHVRDLNLKEVEIFKEDNSQVVRLPDPSLLRVFAPH